LSLKDHLRSNPAFLAQPWQPYHVKDSEKGPMVWEAKRVTMTFKDEDDLPGWGLELVTARDVRDPEKVQYFVSNAPAETATAPLLLVGLTRWHVERCFEDGKSELGFDHWEGRSYLGLKRHQTVSAVSFLLLAETRHCLGGKKPGMDGVPSSDGGGGVGGGDRFGEAGSQETGPACSAVDRSGARGERQSAEEPLAKRMGRTRSHGYTTFKNHSV
jgi:hypothetical protein